MATPTEIQAWIAALEAALGSGELSVRHGDKTVVYRSVDELRLALAAHRAALAGGRRLVTYWRLGGR